MVTSFQTNRYHFIDVKGLPCRWEVDASGRFTVLVLIPQEGKDREFWSGSKSYSGMSLKEATDKVQAEEIKAKPVAVHFGKLESRDGKFQILHCVATGIHASNRNVLYREVLAEKDGNFTKLSRVEQFDPYYSRSSVCPWPVKFKEAIEHAKDLARKAEKHADDLWNAAQLDPNPCEESRHDGKFSLASAVRAAIQAEALKDSPNAEAVMVAHEPGDAI